MLPCRWHTQHRRRRETRTAPTVQISAGTALPPADRGCADRGRRTEGAGQRVGEAGAHFEVIIGSELEHQVPPLAAILELDALHLR